MVGLSNKNAKVSSQTKSIITSAPPLIADVVASNYVLNLFAQVGKPPFLAETFAF